MNKSLRSFLAAVFPPRCVWCGKRTGTEYDVCKSCASSLPRVGGTVCAHCGREKAFCDCRNRENYYGGICAPFYYEGAVKSGIHAFKFRGGTAGVKVFAGEIAKAVNERFPGAEFDFVTEVPMTKRAASKRGYNQCSLLAKETAKLIRAQYRPAVLKKIYETDAQHRLSAIRRRGNLAGVFDVTEPECVRDKTILLIDDISTSGETFNECAEMLWLYGAKTVYCAALALTKPVKKPQKGD